LAPAQLAKRQLIVTLGPRPGLRGSVATGQARAIERGRAGETGARRRNALGRAEKSPAPYDQSHDIAAWKRWALEEADRIDSVKSGPIETHLKDRGVDQVG
jgi:hypothetical protein